MMIPKYHEFSVSYASFGFCVQIGEVFVMASVYLNLHYSLQL